MQGYSSDEKNTNHSDRQKQGQTIMETSLQNHVKDEAIQNNPPKVSKKKVYHCESLNIK